MNKYEARIILLAGSTLCIFLFALLYNAFSRKIDVPSCVPFNKSFEHPSLKQVDDKTYELYMVAQMWSFTPDEIKVPAGSTIDLYLSSKDVVHGFNIVDKAVNLMAVPGAINKTTLHFDKPGVYRIVCHEYCGVGHQNMLGKILVQ
jgi:cytochrome c oxidase subunit 2